jgi:predicted nucleic acid-binding protein
MVLADATIWLEHLRGREERLAPLLAQGEVVCHASIIGELACADLNDRAEILELLKGLPSAPEISHDEALLFMELRALAGAGLGYADVHLLASAVISKASIWTLNPGLRAAAAAMGIAWAPKADL